MSSRRVILTKAACLIAGAIWPRPSPNSVLGLGTFQLEQDTLTDMVTAALDEGFRHIDTAQAYNNETQIGEGIRRADTRRADVFLTTKILSEYFAPEAFLAAAAASLSSDEIAQIDALGVAEGRLVNPETLAPEWD